MEEVLIEKETLYVLPERHFHLFYSLIPNSIIYNTDLPSYIRKKLIKEREKELKKLNIRNRIVENVLKKYNPKVIFLEGDSSVASYRKNLHPHLNFYKLVSLDEGCEPYENFCKEYELIHEKYKKETEKCFNENRYDKIPSLVYKRKVEEANIFKKYSDDSPREGYWFKVIKENYENPSLLICGAGHFLTLRTLYFILLNSNNPLLYIGLWKIWKDKMKGKISILPNLLERIGIKTIVVDYLYA